MRAKPKSNTWEVAVLWTVIALIVIAISLAAVYTIRVFSSATTSITVEDAEPGVRCAKAVTGDGVAIDCWSIER